MRKLLKPDCLLVYETGFCNTHKQHWSKCTMGLITMTKEEAIAFARNYLNERKIDIENDNSYEEAMEYMLNDIIPFLYGEALD